MYKHTDVLWPCVSKSMIKLKDANALTVLVSFLPELYGASVKKTYYINRIIVIASLRFKTLFLPIIIIIN